MKRSRALLIVVVLLSIAYAYYARPTPIIIEKEVVVEKEVPVKVEKAVIVEVKTSSPVTFAFLHKGEGRRHPYTRGYLEDEGGNIKSVIARLNSGAPEGSYTVQVLLDGAVMADFEYELR